MKETTVRQAMQRIRQREPRFSKQLFLVDDLGFPAGMIEIHDLALAAPEEKLGDLVRPVQAVALTTAAGVYFWSRSTGLALIITIAMVIAMVAAAVSGVIIAIVLRRMGQDPPQSSSIILTTVTDVTGFFAFLGIAILLAALI